MRRLEPPCCLLLAGWLASTLPAQVAPSSRPAVPEPVNQAARRVSEALDRLELLAIRGNVQPDEVDAVMRDVPAAMEKPRGGVTQPAGEADSGTPEQMCSLELLTADLCHAAWCLTGNLPESPYCVRALQIYRGVRVDYRNVAVSVMGYVGESKMLRGQRQFDDARAALEPLLNLTRKPTSPLHVELGRIAGLERLEILVAESPVDAAREIAAWRDSRSITQDPNWLARADWLAARALAAELEQMAVGTANMPGILDRVDGVIETLRSEPVAAVIPARDRLRLLEKFEQLLGKPLMTPAEAAAWADTLVVAGSSRATAVYARAAAEADAGLPPDSGLRYAALLMEDESFEAAADVCDRLLARNELTAGQRVVGRRLASACLLQLFRQAKKTADEGRYGRAAATMLLRVIDADAAKGEGVEETVRRECLRQWLEVVSHLDGMGACVATLETHAELVNEDPWLLYALAAGRWERMQERRETAARGSAVQDAETVIGMLERAARLAAAPEARARSVLLHAVIKSSPPLSDAEASLKLLRDAWDVLAAGPDTLTPAVELRLRLLVGLGLTEDALTLVDSLSPETTGPAGEAILSLASILADRFDAASTASRDAERRQIRTLCQKAVSASIGRDSSFSAIRLTAARILLRVGAGRDARALLETANANPATGPTDKSDATAVQLLITEAHAQEGNLNEAIAICNRLSKQNPADHQILMTRGRLGLAVNNPAEAAVWFRKAREARDAGSEPWCEATLGLADALVRDDRHADASTLLRVCLALYPDFATPQLLGTATRLRDQAAGIGKSQ